MKTTVVGVDVQSVAEVETALATFGPRYVRRLFCKEEEDYAETHPNTAARFLAERFAAREAILKLLEADDAMGHWRDLKISSANTSTPAVALVRDSMIRARLRGISTIHLCVDSAGDVAIAVAVADLCVEAGEETT